MQQQVAASPKKPVAVALGASPKSERGAVRSPGKPAAVPVGGRCESPTVSQVVMSNLEESAEWLFTPIGSAMGLSPSSSDLRQPLESNIALDLGTILQGHLRSLLQLVTCNMIRASPVPTRELAPERPSGLMGGMARAIRSCCVGAGDLQVDELIAAAQPVLECLECLGGWTALSVREGRANLVKLQQSAALREARARASSAGEGDGGPRVSAVLQAEAAAGLHGSDEKGPKLADPSAAIGLLWLLRFLGMWMVMWRVPPLPTFREQLMRAYRERMEPCRRRALVTRRLGAAGSGRRAHSPRYHGWVLRCSFSVAVAVVPHWGEARDRIKTVDPSGEAGLLLAVAAMPPMLERLEAQLRDHGMLDTSCRTF